MRCRCGTVTVIRYSQQPRDTHGVAQQPTSGYFIRSSSRSGAAGGGSVRMSRSTLCAVLACNGLHARVISVTQRSDRVRSRFCYIAAGAGSGAVAGRGKQVRCQCQGTRHRRTYGKRSGSCEPRSRATAAGRTAAAGCSRYNNQGFPYGPFRRNDLLIPLEVRAVFWEPVWGPHRLHAWYANGKNDHGNFVVPFAGTLGNLAQVSMRSTAPCQAMPMTEPQLPLTVAMLCTMQANSVDLWGGVDWAFVDRVVAHKV